jgi:DNA gyrase/topoisomerase IV subunit A
VNFGVIMLAIVNGQPRELGLIDLLMRFIDHRIDVVRPPYRLPSSQGTRPRAYPARFLKALIISTK